MRVLRETVEIYKGHKAPEVFDEPQEGTKRYLQIEDLRPDTTIKYARDPNGTFANRDDVIIAWDGANAGTVGFGLEGYIGSTLAVLHPDPNELFAPYLGYFLQSKFDYIRGNTTGATIPHVSRDALENLRIEIPPLPEQQRIAVLLDRADRLRRTRRYAQELSDSFLQAVFVEMFGDQYTNSMGWDKSIIEEISTQVTDGEHVTPERSSSGIKLLSARNIKNGYIDFDAGLDYVSESEHRRIKRRLNPEFGDILMSCSGTVGRVTTVDITEPFSLVRSVALIKPKREIVEPKYLEHYLRSDYGQDLIQRRAKQSSQANIFGGPIREIPVLIPPLPLQQKFARVVQQFERLRAQQREAERQAEHLFQTLLQRAFRGEM